MLACGFQNCSQIFHNIKGLRNHRHQKHSTPIPFLCNGTSYTISKINSVYQCPLPHCTYKPVQASEEIYQHIVSAHNHNVHIDVFGPKDGKYLSLSSFSKVPCLIFFSYSGPSAYFLLSSDFGSFYISTRYAIYISFHSFLFGSSTSQPTPLPITNISSLLIIIMSIQMVSISLSSFSQVPCLIFFFYSAPPAYFGSFYVSSR